MSSLEDLLPEMAGVFAAQESALANCVSVLSTQLQNLGSDCSRQLRRVATLEESQRSLLGMVVTLQDTVAALQRQNEILVEQQAAQTEELVTLRDLATAASSIDFSGLTATLASELKAQTTALVAEQLAQVETKLTDQMNERMVEVSNRAFQQSQNTEELIHGQLEMLEKKFDFLSKVKMEIKDLGKRMEKQDQTLDDMRTGLALLAKSVGSDEIDDDEEHEDDATEAASSSRNKHPITSEAPVIVMPVVVAFESEADEGVGEITHEPLQEEPLSQSFELTEPSTDEGEAVQEDQNPLVGAVVEDASVVQAEQLSEVSPTEAALEEPSHPLPTVVEETPASEPTEEIAVDTIVETPPIEEQPVVVVDQQPEDTPPSAPSTEPEIVPPAPQPESDTPPPSEPPQAESMPEPAAVVAVDEKPPSTGTPPGSNEGLDVVTPPTETQLPQPTPFETEAKTSPRTDDSEEEAEDKDDFQELPPLPIQRDQKPSHPSLQHMPTAPSLSTVAYIRSRRQERTAKRGTRRDLVEPQPLQPHVPHTREEIRVLWLHIFNKIVQLKRLQSINGSSPERALFRKQNMSMGARVKRLEETTGDLEATIEMLETSIQTTNQSLQVLSEAAAQSSTTLDKKTKKIDEVQRMQAQSILGIEEKVEAFESEFRRIRNGVRRESQGSVSSALMTQVASKMHDITDRLGGQTKSIEDHESKLKQLLQSDLPHLTASVQSTVVELRADVDFKTREAGKEMAKAIETLRAGQETTHQKLQTQLSDSTSALYRVLLVLTSAILVAAEFAAKHSNAKPSPSPTKKTKQKSLLDVSIGLLQSVMGTFESDCQKVLASSGSRDETSGASALVSILLDKLQQFHYELAKLKEQADKAIAITSSTNDAGTTSNSKGFEEHLVQLCTSHLRTLEEILVSQTLHPSNESDHHDDLPLVLAHVKDLVIQFRAVLFLLVMHAQLIESPHQIQTLQAAHASMDSKVTAHDFALTQLATVEAVVKMMNSRLDSFMDMSFSFAKDADVKKSIQDMLNANDELRETLVKHVDSSNVNAVKRDELLEREVSQLAGRVQKKLDKDEMLWTQEVLERQLQNVAKGALGEQDLADIQRALRSKMDKTQFQALLLQQHAKLQELGAGNGPLSQYGGAGNQPLAATRCISCDSDLTASTEQMRAAVREEVQQEVAKALAAAKHCAPQASPSTSPSPGFNASSHRSMDKHKKELLMAALQQRK